MEEPFLTKPPETAGLVDQTQIKYLAGKVLVDSTLEVTGVGQFDKNIELVAISTPTYTLAANHADLWLNESAKKLCTRFDDGSSGCLANTTGNYVSSIISTPANSAATGTYKDITSISLTTGTWEVSGIVLGELNGATVTAEYGVISLFSGVTATDHVFGDNQIMVPPPAASYHSAAVIPSWRVVAASATTVYLKVKFDFSAGTPQYVGRISAWSH